MVTFVLSSEPLFSVRSHCLLSGAIILDKRGIVLRMRTEHVTQLQTVSCWDITSFLDKVVLGTGAWESYPKQLISLLIENQK